VDNRKVSPIHFIRIDMTYTHVPLITRLVTCLKDLINHESKISLDDFMTCRGDFSKLVGGKFGSTKLGALKT
jgi:hypothetical protein